MNSAPYYLICGPFHEDHGCTFWSMEKGWVDSEDFYSADIFPADIMTLPLPEGATGIMAFKSDAEPVAQFDLLPRGGVVENFFTKSY